MKIFRYIRSKESLEDRRTAYTKKIKADITFIKNRTNVLHVLVGKVSPFLTYSILIFLLYQILGGYFVWGLYAMLSYIPGAYSIASVLTSVTPVGYTVKGAFLKKITDFVSENLSNENNETIQYINDKITTLVSDRIEKVMGINEQISRITNNENMSTYAKASEYYTLAKTYFPQLQSEIADNIEQIVSGITSEDKPTDVLDKYLNGLRKKDLKLIKKQLIEHYENENEDIQQNQSILGHLQQTNFKTTKTLKPNGGLLKVGYPKHFSNCFELNDFYDNIMMYDENLLECHLLIWWKFMEHQSSQYIKNQCYLYYKGENIIPKKYYEQYESKLNTFFSTQNLNKLM